MKAMESDIVSYHSYIPAGQTQMAQPFHLPALWDWTRWPPRGFQLSRSRIPLPGASLNPASTGFFRFQQGSRPMFVKWIWSKTLAGSKVAESEGALFREELRAREILPSHPFPIGPLLIWRSGSGGLITCSCCVKCSLLLLEVLVRRLNLGMSCRFLLNTWHTTRHLLHSGLTSVCYISGLKVKRH